MRISAAEKLEIIQLVDRSEIGVKRTLRELGIHKSTFYKWYQAYLANGQMAFSRIKEHVDSGTQYLMHKSNWWWKWPWITLYYHQGNCL